MAKCPVCGNLMNGRVCESCGYIESKSSIQVNIKNEELSDRQSEARSPIIKGTLGLIVIIIFSVCLTYFLSHETLNNHINDTESVASEVKSDYDDTEDFEEYEEYMAEAYTSEDMVSSETPITSESDLNIDVSNFDEEDALNMQRNGSCIRYVTMVVPYDFYCESGNEYKLNEDLDFICKTIVSDNITNWFAEYDNRIVVSGGVDFQENQFTLMLSFKDFESTSEVDACVNDFINDFYTYWANSIDDRCEDLGYSVDRSQTFVVLQ